MALDDQKEIDLRDSGLLYHLNKLLFHPRGYGLAYDIETKQLFVMGDGTEKWNYEEELDRESLRKLKAFVDEQLPVKFDG